MANSACNFYINDNFNANYDITWSFQYSVTGSNTSTGGFCTFLFADDGSGLVGGAPYRGLGYTSYSGTNGVSNAVLGILFDSDNKITIKKGSSFTTLTSFNSFRPLISSVDNFETIRFNLTNVGKTLNIDIKNKNTNIYDNIISFNFDLEVTDSSFYKIGFSYASPLTANRDKIEFKIKNIHIQGNKNTFTSIFYNPRPYTPITYYLIQSPTSGKIAITNSSGLSSGYLLHK